MTAIVMKNNQYRIDFGTHEMVYDRQGHYLGQYQENAEDDGRTFYHGINGCISFRGQLVPINDLSHFEMTTLEFIENGI